MRYFQGFIGSFFSVLLVVGCDSLGGKANLKEDPPDPMVIALCNAREVETIAGHFDEKFIPTTAPGKAFDAREAYFLNNDVKWSMISVEGGPNDKDMCWLGGYVHTNKPWNASWDDHADLDGPTRNSAAISIASMNVSVSGLHYFNVYDGVRTTEAFDWVVERNWGEYVRDDCVENDHLHSGRVFDSLFDGCYAGISTKPRMSDSSSIGVRELVEVDSVLLRLQAMPYPYKWETNEDLVDADGSPYTGSGVSYGHGSFFKLTDVDRNPHFSIKNSTFLATHLTESSKLDFPPESLLDDCQNNTIIWLGPGSFPGALPDEKFPDCVQIVIGQEGQNLWQEKVADWHFRHPEVGANRKPALPGDLTFPKTF